MKLIIAGGRDFNDIDYMYDKLDEMFDYNAKITQVVSGHCRGADKMGEMWGDERLAYIIRENRVKTFPAKWKEEGWKAGHNRNVLMGDYADELVAFWDGESRGTKHMIDYMISIKKPVHIFPY